MEYGLVLWWLLLFVALGAAGLPIAARLFPRLDGRGAGLSVPVATAVLGVTVYWLGRLRYGPLAIAAGAVVLLGLSAAAGLDRDALRERRLRPAPDPEVDRAAAGEAAVVFLLAFLLLVAVRAFDPAVHAGGGEKFLDFGLLKALERAGALPPEDMWFAGEPVQYYYGGHLIASILSGLALTPPRFAYNLALAGFYAMVVTAAYDLAAAIAAERGASRRVGGALAAVFVGIGSNLVTAGNVALGLLPPGPRRRVAELLAASASDHSVDDLLAGPGEFSYWAPSRVIEGTINEFPLFAWLNGDLHAHMMGTPFLLLGAALAYAYYRTPGAELRRRRALAFGALPLLGSLQAVVDTWSLPTLFGLFWLAATFAPAHPLSLAPGGAERRLRQAGRRDGLTAEVVRAGGALVVAGLSALIAAALASPFLLSASGGERAPALLEAARRSGIGALLLVHGAFVAGFGAYLADRLDLGRPRAAALTGAAVAAVSAVALGRSMPVLLLTLPLGVGAWAALRFDRPVGYETVLAIAGAGLVTVVEFVYLSEQAGPGRMNTVFKTYMQVWVLWGTGVGAALATFVGGGRARSRLRSRVGRGLPRSTARVLGTGFVLLLVVSTSFYAALALGGHFGDPYVGDEGPTLDATRFGERFHPAEMPAVRWLDRRDGTPTIVSAPGTSLYPGKGYGHPPGMYTWDANPAASLTGVPTVAGWGHEVGYRGTEPYVSRVRHVDDIYTADAARQAALLRRYDVRYVWVGPAERARYDRIRIDRIPGVEVAYEAPAVTVYRVDPGELPA